MQFIVPGYALFCISNACQSDRLIETNSNWSTVGLRDYKNGWLLGAHDYSSWAHNHKQGSSPESTVPPALIFHFNPRDV